MEESNAAPPAAAPERAEPSEAETPEPAPRPPEDVEEMEELLRVFI